MRRSICVYLQCGGRTPSLEMSLLTVGRKDSPKVSIVMKFIRRALALLNSWSIQLA